MRGKLTKALICLVLLAGTIFLYWPVGSYPLILVDDSEYVAANANVRAGFTEASIRSVFRGTGANWMPLSMLSHMLDYKLYGEQYGRHHLTSVFIHALACVFLFLFLDRSTFGLASQHRSGTTLASAFVAAVFAVHPLHVESVAWVAERKDVLCALFWFLALLLWTMYLERPSILRYSIAMLVFALGLMSKPMIVSFPFLLLVLDSWPFRRGRSWWLLIEKIPAIGLCVLLAVITFHLQDAAEAVASIQILPFSKRLENSLLTVIHYQWNTAWPKDLIFGYHYPRHIPLILPVLAGVWLLAFTGTAILLRRTFPWLLSGWLWFLLAVFPVVGLVQVGTTARADRYMLVPMVGLLILWSWAGINLVHHFPGIRNLIVALALTACGAFALSTRHQITWWSSSEKLLRHTLDIEPDNEVALNHLSSLWMSTPGRLSEALVAAQKAVQLRPEVYQLHAILSRAYTESGRHVEAAFEAEAALRLRPDLDANWNLAGSALYDLENLAGAKGYLERALALNPQSVAAHYTLSLVLQKMGARSEAMKHLESAVRLKPTDPAVQSVYGAELLRQGKTDEAVLHLDESVRLDPGLWEAQFNLGLALLGNQYRYFDAISHIETSLRLKPKNPDAHRVLGIALLRVPGRERLAIRHLELALQLVPDPVLQRQVDSIRLKFQPAR